jgi:hypothetical protein
MFIGTIPQETCRFIGSLAPQFAGKEIVVGCSGNFTSETVIAATAAPAAVHSNDVSLYSCMLGRWLTGQPVEYRIADAAFDWLEPFLDDDRSRLASLMVLVDMLPFEKRDNPHKVRMWERYRDAFPDLVGATEDRLMRATARTTTFFAGDVREHFERHDRPGSVFLVFAPTYAGGYERLYKRLDRIVAWDEPTYPTLDDARRDALIDWLRDRRHLWFDDRVREGESAVMELRSGRKKTVYLYANLDAAPAFFGGFVPAALPALPLATPQTAIGADSAIWLHPMKTSDLARFKDAFLAKGIKFAAGTWAFAVMVDGVAVGFCEFARSPYKEGEIYAMSDFVVPHTRYPRLSKLIVMLLRSTDVRKALERRNEARLHTVTTTAFTDKPVSMKYRGALDLLKRGTTKEGTAFLQYGGPFTDRSAKEVLAAWVKTHGSTTR